MPVLIGIFPCTVNIVLNQLIVQYYSFRGTFFVLFVVVSAKKSCLQALICLFVKIVKCVHVVLVSNYFTIA